MAITMTRAPALRSSLPGRAACRASASCPTRCPPPDAVQVDCVAFIPDLAIENLQPPVADDEPPRFAELIHKAEIVGCDERLHGARFVQFDEEPQQAPRQSRIDIARRFVREKKLRHRTMSARAIAARCFSPPDSTAGKAFKSMRSPRPTQRSSSTTSAR